MTITLDPGQIIDLLTVAASYDQRTASQDDVKAWTAAAAHARWDYRGAVAAIVDHYANRTERIMPGHITQWIRAQRHDAALRQPALEVHDQPPARPWRTEWNETQARVKLETAERRALLLRHPDLAATLSDPPLRLTNPQQWTGYIPPATLSDGQPNRSPVRTQLVALVTKALDRECCADDAR